MYETIDEFWNDYLSFIYKDIPKGIAGYIFRGVTDISHQLIPSIGRGIETGVQSDPYWVESKLMAEFQRLSVPILKNIDLPKTEFEWLFLAQHYGLPTRLLDWTTNLLVALYFATEKDDDKNGLVYALKRVATDRYELFSPSTADYKEESEKINANLFLREQKHGEVLFIRPKYFDARHTNQQSIFSCPANPFKPSTFSDMKTFEFKGEWKLELRNRLRTLGVSTSFIYPGLEGIAAETKAFYHEPIKDGKSTILPAFGRELL